MIIIMLNDLFQLMESLPGRNVSLDAGEMLFGRGDSVASMYVLASGHMDLVRYQEDGKPVRLHKAYGKCFIAEASLHATHYHCDALCMEEAVLYEVARTEFQHCIYSNPDISKAWIQHLAASLQNERYRSELLTRKTVLERLEGWLDWNGGQLPPKGKWKHLANELGVTPEALYRTLALGRK